jgi:NAD(P)-dependent dehydrogenase (short-subunit alcohol dehydrogenase family)
VFLVTGGNRGLGAETIKILARQGHRVVLTSRDRAMGEAVAAEARALSTDAKVDVIDMDLSSQASVRAAADAFLALGLPLHALVANAAVYAPDAPRASGEGGVEAHFAANHLGHYLLTRLLIERLRQSSPSRVAVLTSGMHMGMPGLPPATLDLDDLPMANGKYVGEAAYARSKLANILFAYELDRRERANGVNANAVSPAMVPATVERHAQGFQKFLMRWVFPWLPIARTPEQAASNTVFAATDPSLVGLGGLYIEDGKRKKSSPLSYDEALARRLWDVSAKLVGLPP